MSAAEVQSWLPAILALASAVATVTVLRYQQRHTDGRLSKIEKTLEHLTPRAAEVINLRAELEEVRHSASKSREVLLQHGWLLPEDAPRQRTRTPVRGVPVGDSGSGEDE